MFVARCAPFVCLVVGMVFSCLDRFVTVTLASQYHPHRQILVSVKFVSAILGPEMAAPILWAPAKCVLSAGKPMSHKIPRFRGGGFGGGGESADFIFMGAGIFLNPHRNNFERKNKHPRFGIFSLQEYESESEKKSLHVLHDFRIVACCCASRVPNMFITKQMLKRTLGNLFAFPLRKRKRENIPRSLFAIVSMRMVRTNPHLVCATLCRSRNWLHQRIRIALAKRRHPDRKH